MNSIRVKLLVWFGLALLLLLTILGIITYLQVRDTVVPLTKELSLEVLEARSSEMSRLVDGYTAEVKTISQLDVIKSGDFEAIATYLIGIDDQINPHYEMIFYADRNGDFITTNNLRGNIGDREYFQVLMHGEDEYHISNPMISRSTGEDIFVVAWAVFGPNGEKQGVLASTVLLETLSGIAGDIDIGEKGFGYIVDQTGLLIAHPNESLRMSLNFIDSERLGYSGLTEVGRAMSEGKTAVMSYTRPNGEKLVTAFNPIPHTPGWSLGVAMYEEELLGRANDLMQHIVATMVGIILAVLLMVYYLSKRISEPIIMLKNGVKTVSAGDLDHILDIKTGDEIEELARAFNKMTEDLKEYISNLQKTTAEKERIESELQVANKIQSSMLPRSFPPYPDIENLDLYAMMEPAREVGGDFYDFFPLDAHRFCFSVGDVSGKGIPAALFMVITRTILKNQAMQGSSLDDTFYRANNLLCSDNVEDMFVTVFMGILNTQNGEVEYVCAGHNPPLISRQGGEYRFLEVKRNLVLGGMENYPYQVQRLTLQPGDVIFLYTDGVNEAMNDSGKLFGDERMLAALNRSSDDEVRMIIKKVKDNIAAYVGETPASDDLTMLALTLTKR
jgi:phosphoserine phosphatase RsbU/P